MPGSFQSELGCPGDWDPDCLRSWLQDPDGDGIYTFSTAALPAGNYEAKVAIDESWDVNYGAGGARNGANIAFTVRSPAAEMFFVYDSTSHVLTVTAGGAPRGNLTLAQAHWVLADTIAWARRRPPAADATVAPARRPGGGLGLDAHRRRGRHGPSS